MAGQGSGGTQMPGSRKVAILATLLGAVESDPEGRLGPPESTENTENSGKHGKHQKTRFLRV